LAALRTGGETNPPVLLVPGWTGSKEDFGPILEPLGEAGYLVTAVDQRGQFRSPFRPDGDYSPIALGNDLRLAAAALGGGVHLLGHSFGGLVARAAGAC
jgi:pimeloyl-ACP methyl ester carboxylesterase